VAADFGGDRPPPRTTHDFREILGSPQIYFRATARNFRLPLLFHSVKLMYR
jgi:hypothetical protein